MIAEQRSIIVTQIEGFFSTLIEAFQGKISLSWKTSYYLNRCIKYIKIRGIRCRHIFGEANGLADALAEQGQQCDQVGTHTLKELPDGPREAWRRDMLGLPAYRANAIATASRCFLQNQAWPDFV